MTKNTRRILALGLVLAIAAGAVWALRPTPLSVETATVTRGRLSATVVAEGKTRVKNLYVVAASVDGDLERIAPEPGDPVTPGAVIARIWPMSPRPLDVRSRREAEAAVESARTTVTRAAATEREAAAALTHAESELATAQKLSSEGVTAQKNFERASHEAQTRRAALDAARAAVQTAQADLQRAQALVATGIGQTARPATLVASPVTGRVLRVLRVSAGPVQAGTPLVEIGDTNDIEIAADLLTADAMQVRPGATATLRDWGGEPISARVRRIDPAAFTKVSALGIEEQRVPVMLDLVRPPPAALGHDFRVNAAIVTWQAEGVLTVPSTALFRARGGRWAVFTVRDGRARLTAVTPGPSDGARTVIERGLADGDTVVVQPSDALSDSARVVATTRRAL
jgi:HlyD family secretion protein